jgi:plasmid stabilization system protein ParE
VTTRWQLHAQATADLERLRDFLLESAPEAALETVGIIPDGLHILGSHPLVGRPVDHGLRELVISRGRTGYLALYRYDAQADLVLVLALRHQRENDYH